jgi:predicted nucleic acid-binding protein
MRFVYIDSSALVSVALGDARGVQARALLDARQSCTSEFSVVECQGGLSSHLQASGQLSAAERVLDDLLGRLQIVRMTPLVIALARVLVRRYRVGIGLRAADALHVASCQQMQDQLGSGALEYLTADRRQHSSFQAEGFSGRLLP